MAKQAISSQLTGQQLKIVAEDLPGSFLEKRATFVTLHKNGRLRGCIGELQAKVPLYQSVIDNARLAAFKDPRFLPVQLNELDQLEIEVSILSLSKPLAYLSQQDLIRQLEESKPGVVLKQGNKSATFLPQVWEELPTGELFLSQLCLKAGLAKDQWQQEKVEIEIYQVEKIEAKASPSLDVPDFS